MTKLLNPIDKALRDAKIISSSDYPKIAIMSDCHRGSGKRNDNFLPNRVLYTAALRHYYNNDFAYIELGDGDELWENKSFVRIYKVYREIFSILMAFHKEDRLFMLNGNHDMIKKKKKSISLAPGFSLPFYESIILLGESDIHMLHGHQGDLINDYLWKASRFVVRHFWAPLELLGFNDPTGAAINNHYRGRSETRMENWTIARDKYLIAGHTHKATLIPSSKYMNCGSCVHPEAITAIEIETKNGKQKASLVKWSICTNEAMNLYVCRKELSNTLLT